MKNQFFAVVVLGALLGACASSNQTLSPKAQYIKAIDHRLEGDAQSYEADLIALAHNYPDSRVGRKAKATLSSTPLVFAVAGVGVLAAIAVPNFKKFQSRARASEVKTNLKIIFAAQQAFFVQHQRFCTTFEECGWTPPKSSQYIYYLSVDAAAGGEGSGEAGLLRLKGDATFAKLGLMPYANETGFLAMGIGDPDGDGRVEVWSIDNDNALVPLDRGR